MHNPAGKATILTIILSISFADHLHDEFAFAFLSSSSASIFAKCFTRATNVGVIP